MYRKVVRKRRQRLTPSARGYYSVYVLALIGGRYYVGSTRMAVHRRFVQHATGMGAKWTALYRPVRIAKIYPLGVCTKAEAEMHENVVTIEWMRKYGVEMVRGGEFCHVDGVLNAGYRRKLNAAGLR